MVHDFAKQHASQRNNGKRKKSRTATSPTGKSGSHWSWFYSGLVSGIFIAFIIYQGVFKPDPAAPQFTTTDNSETTTATNNDSDQNQTEFNFYKTLPEAEVLVDVIPVSIVAEETVNDTISYLLQAGSFPDKNDAESRRATIILLNMQANVVPGVVSGKTWHRVQVGPFIGRVSTENARDTLLSNNIDTILLRMR